MLFPGDVYHCAKIKDDPTSGHWWVLLYVDTNKVLYITATSRIEPFIYKEDAFGDLQQPERHPSSAVFLDVNKVKGLNGSPIFSEPTFLNCYHPPENIVLEEFELRVDHSQLRKEGRLPNQYLAQIVPSARCCPGGKWSRNEIKKVLDKQYGIGGCVDAFYSNLR